MNKIIKLVGILLLIFCITGCKMHKHELIHVNPKEATCMEAGMIEHWKCNTCDKYYLDKKGKTETQDITIKRLEHTYDTSNIKWEWSDDNEGAVAVLTCKNDETHQERIQAIITKEETTEAISFKATITYNNGTYIDEKTKQFSQGLEYTLNEDGTSYIVAGIGTCTDTAISIPSIYNQLPVTSIGDWAFFGCNSLTNITMPDTISSIGASALDGCNQLTNIIIPSSVTNIGGSAFKGCSSLTNLIIPTSVVDIRYGAFSNCSGLTSITIPFVDSKSFGYFFGYAANVPSTLKEVIITGGTSIRKSAFSGCKNIINIIIPESVTSIGDSAFAGCSSLASIVIPESVTSIGDSAFSDCSSLTSITIPKSVVSIGKGALYGCNNLTSITIPFVGENVNGTGKKIFGCIFGTQHSSDNSQYVPSSLKKVIITGGTSIGMFAFSGCSHLTDITISSTVTTIEGGAFFGCTSLTNITISESVTLINTIAFSNCSSLTSIIIPESVTHIGSSAFEECNYLTIYCEALSQPSGWRSDWNSSNRPVVWGYE